MADQHMERLAHALLGPRNGKLTPGDESSFQTFMAFDPSVRNWRNAFTRQHGEPPQIDGGNYDYRAAWQAGSRPQPVQGDTVPHWSSVGKSADHPTMWKQDFMTKFGVDPDVAAQNSLPPDQSQAINQQLSRDMLARLLMGGR